CPNLFPDSYSLFLYQASYNAESIMQRTICLIENQRVCPSHENGDSLTLCLYTRNPDNSFSRRLSLFHQVGTAEFVFSERINICNRLASRSLGDELNLVSLNIFDYENVKFREEMER